ncbi:hypothetical protein A7U60_g7350 [Sanghuangporus baumii]|uniref:Uncharacterized protein n=1 Tax=Sanghuangporus baumii TaxID=108892 RepID=A0A9Q5N9T4_SANBA|nr:hypothetical protein A7U60_g7350 [Sanghuangporus baumii]
MHPVQPRSFVLLFSLTNFDYCKMSSQVDFLKSISERFSPQDVWRSISSVKSELNTFSLPVDKLVIVGTEQRWEVLPLPTLLPHELPYAWRRTHRVQEVAFSKKFGPEPFEKLLAADLTTKVRDVAIGMAVSLKSWQKTNLLPITPHKISQTKIQEEAKLGSKFPLPRIKGNFYH